MRYVHEKRSKDKECEILVFTVVSGTMRGINYDTHILHKILVLSNDWNWNLKETKQFLQST